MTLNDLRNAVVSGIQDAVPGDVGVEAHPGRFDLRELARVATGGNAIRVAMLEKDTTPLGALGVNATVDMVAYVVTSGDRNQSADERGLLLESLLLALVDMNNWGIACEPAGHVRARNLYSTELAKKFAVSLAAITWRQTLELGAEEIEPGEVIRDVWVGFEPEQFPRDYVHLIDSEA